MNFFESEVKGKLKLGGGPKFTSGSEVNVRKFLVRVGGGGGLLIV